MGKFFLLAMSILALLLYPALYCRTRLAYSASPLKSQREVLHQFLDERKVCLCEEINVAYSFRDKDGYERQHIAMFSPDQKTLRIETDPGSGWSFGWENVDEQLIRKVLQEGGQFSLFTKYRPNSRHLPLPEYRPAY